MRVLVVKSLDDGLEAILGPGCDGLDSVAEVDDEAPIFGRFLSICHSL
jgi:hypothetical protein